MFYGNRVKRAAAVVVAVTSLSAPQVYAQISDTFRPYVAARITWDDNVFRSELRPEKDVITRIGAGVDLNMPISRQQVLATARAEQVLYDTNDSLDHQDVEGRALWNWVVGSRFSGDLGYRYLRTIASFEETGGRTKNNQTDTRAFGTANFLLTPDWELVGSYAAETSRIEERPEVDNDTGNLAGEIRWALGPRTRIGGRLSQTTADFLYLEDINGVLVSNDYTAYNASGTFYWQSTGKSALTARIGYTSVEHEAITSRDVSGRAYRGDYFWSITAATDINFSAWRDASNRDEVSGVVVTQGVEIRPRWRMTELLELSATALYEQVDFKGEVNYIVELGETRKDDLAKLTMALGYDITRMSDLALSYTWTDRESNNPGSSYTYNALTLSGRMNF